MPKLATLVKEYKKRGEVIVVDSGDRVSGNAYVDDATEPGRPIIELMNDIGYDVATLGNHEFDKGSEVLDAMISYADFPIVCANVEAQNGATAIEPYTIIERCGVEFGFIGIVDTDNSGRPLGGNSAFANYTFTPDIETAYQVCEVVAPQCDMVILLSHMGLDRDIILAEQTPYYHWIAGGHSHDLVNERYEYTHMSQNKNKLRYATVADVRVKDEDILDVKYEQIAIADIAADKAMMEHIEELKSSDPKLNSIVGHATATATKDGVANFTIEALAHYPYDNGFVPEISFYHYGGIRLEEIKEGGVKRVEILNNDPFMSTIYIGTMTKKQLRDFILAKYNSGTPERPDKESHYPYFRSDVPYTIVLGEDGDAKDVIFNLEERSYRVAMCNYIADNYINSVIVSRQLRPTNVSVRDALFHYLETFENGTFTPDNECHQIEKRVE
ncbi:MAG: bifunctional metallophosphatase/5'-nucleotidase [Alistipes sp.]|nr:bifunctional metallophosphatase/5'-nucleotidase [Alistipes sp.]